MCVCLATCCGVVRIHLRFDPKQTSSFCLVSGRELMLAVEKRSVVCCGFQQTPERPNKSSSHSHPPLSSLSLSLSVAKYVASQDCNNWIGWLSISNRHSVLYSITTHPSKQNRCSHRVTRRGHLEECLGSSSPF